MQKLKTTYLLLDRWEDKVFKWLEIIGTILLILAFFAVGFQVLYRCVLAQYIQISFVFTDEFARYCLIWIIYLLLPVSIKEGTESSVTFLHSRAKSKAAKVSFFILIRIICITVAVIAFKYSFTVIDTYWLYRSPTMQLPGPFIYGSVSVGMLLILIHYALELIGLICGEFQPFSTNSMGVE